MSPVLFSVVKENFKGSRVLQSLVFNLPVHKLVFCRQSELHLLSDLEDLVGAISTILLIISSPETIVILSPLDQQVQGQFVGEHLRDWLLDFHLRVLLSIMQIVLDS